MKNGRVQTWEINLYPTIGRGLRPARLKLSPELAAVREQVKEHFFQSFERGWRDVLLPTNGQPALAVKIDPHIINAAKADEGSSGVFLMREIIPELLRTTKPRRNISESIALAGMSPLYFLTRFTKPIRDPENGRARGLLFLSR